MKRILGYCAPWAVHGGESLAIKVSALHDPQYQLDVVRVICGTDLPGGPPTDLRVMPTKLDGTHAGHAQTNPIGSAIRVDMKELPNAETIAGFRVAIWPTWIGPARQALIGWWDDDAQCGALLVLEGDGRVSLTIGAQRLLSAKPLRERVWVELDARFASGTMSLQIRTLGIDAPPCLVQAPAATPQFPTHLPLLIAAIADPAGGRWHRHHFNGKIESPLVLDAQGMYIGAWDFARDHDSAYVHDAGPFGLHGKAINLPSRAVRSSAWTGEVFDWRFAPKQYAAIHFHADDLYDAGWTTSHEFHVPVDWPSGAYAVRLRAGDDETMLPFFVTPRPGRPTAKLAVIASTATSIAYANQSFHMRVADEEPFLGRMPVLSREDVFLRQTPWLGLSHYDTHEDGSGVRYSSRLRPVVNMAPFTDAWNLNADTLLYAWLDKINQPFDMITDEDLHVHGVSLLASYACVIAGSHPEYYTSPMRQALEDYLGQAGRLMYLGGNGFYWRVAFSPHWPGALELRRAEGGARYWAETPGESHMAFTGEYGGLWRRCGKPPQALVGIGMRAIGFDGIGHYDMQPDAKNPRAAFIVEGLESVTRFGETGALGSAAGEELDAIDTGLGTPERALVIASSGGHTAFMQVVPEDMLMPHLGLSGAYNPHVRADIVFFETPSGGAVFATGSMTWTASLCTNNYDNPVARMTANVLRRFLAPERFVPPESDR